MEGGSKMRIFLKLASLAALGLEGAEGFNAGIATLRGTTTPSPSRCGVQKNAQRSLGLRMAEGTEDTWSGVPGRGIDIPLGDSAPGGMGKMPNIPGMGGKEEGDGFRASEHEILLAELAFSNPMELPKLVEKNLDKLDDLFYKFLDNKISNSLDDDEKETLTLLKDAVTDLMTKIVDAAVKRGDLSKEEVEAAGIQTSGIIDVEGFDAADMALASYDAMIDKLAAHPAPILSSEVQAVYDRIDMRFLERLNERMQKEPELVGLNSAIQETMSQRIQKASEALQGILKAGDPQAMQKELMLLNAKGGLDESVVLLLEANIDQAKKAGAAQAVEVMGALKEKAIEYKDQSMPEEIRLIRQLLRTDDVSARKTMLVEAFKPREKIQLPDGTETKPQAVNGRRFVQSLRELIEQYGNVEDDFQSKCNEIAEESEMVASELFGLNSMDTKQLQDEAFHKRSISVWDLEQIEEGYEAAGQKAPWFYPSQAGWDEDGNMVIGGDRKKQSGQDGVIF